ncbi:MAG: hypothetical protein AAGA92_06890 [Planctomycetota bacterium]
MPATAVFSFPTNGPFDLVETLNTMTMGMGNPCLRVDSDSAARLTLATPEGPAALAAWHDDDELRVEPTGPGAEWLQPFLTDLFGLRFKPPVFENPRRMRVVGERFAGLRLPKLPTIFPRLLQVVLQQMITFRDATHGWRKLVERLGARVPGHDDLWYPPEPKAIARMASFEFIECGILPQHGRRLVGLARTAERIEAVWGHGLEADSLPKTCEYLMSLPGVGPWTVGYLSGSGLGDADALVLGDYGHPHQVAYFFTGEERSDDETMASLLEPYRPHRYYALTLIIKSGVRPPRRGPRRRSLRERFRH